MCKVTVYNVTMLDCICSGCQNKLYCTGIKKWCEMNRRNPEYYLPWKLEDEM